MADISSEAVRQGSRPGGLEATPFGASFTNALSALRRRLWLFLGIALGVGVLVACVTMLEPPSFTSQATLAVNERSPDVLGISALNPAEAQAQLNPASSSTVDTQVQVLKSRSLAARVVDQLHLETLPEFNATLRPPTLMSRVMDLFHGSVSGLDDPAAIKARERESVIDAVSSKLVVKRAGFSYAVDLIFTAREPQVAAAVANAFVQIYLTQGLETKVDASKTATSWLSARLTELKGNAEAADSAVQQFKIANNLLSAQGATLTEQEITNLDTQLAAAKAQDAEQDARLRTAQQQLAAGSNGGDVGEALNNPVIGTLRTQRAQTSAHLADLQSRYGDKYPEVMKTKQSLDDIDTQIQGEISRVLSNLKAQSTVAHTRTGSLAGTTAAARASLAGNNRSLVRLEQLQRDADAAKEVYEAFLARYKEALAKEGNQAPDATIVSTAKVPVSPSAPNKRLDLLLAAVLGLASGSAAILLAELLKRGVSTSAEVQQAFDLPFLGEIPSLRSTLPRRAKGAGRVDPARYVADKPLSRFAEAFRNLRAAILSSRVGATVRVVAITSSLPGEGKTTTAICLARTVALSGSKVVLVDCDLRKRSVNRLLRREPESGLIEVLNGSATLEQALYKDEETGAMILPLSRTAFTPKDVLGSPEMLTLLKRLRDMFDLVLLDTAPVLAVADTRVLAPHADAVVMLTGWRRTSRKAVMSSLQALHAGGAFLAGVALTKVNVREQAKAGEGSTHYYRAYDSYYVG